MTARNWPMSPALKEEFEELDETEQLNKLKEAVSDNRKVANTQIANAKSKAEDAVNKAEEIASKSSGTAMSIESSHGQINKALNDVMVPSWARSDLFWFVDWLVHQAPDKDSISRVDPTGDRFEQQYDLWQESKRGPYRAMRYKTITWEDDGGLTRDNKVVEVVNFTPNGNLNQFHVKVSEFYPTMTNYNNVDNKHKIKPVDYFMLTHEPGYPYNDDFTPTSKIQDIDTFLDLVVEGNTYNISSIAARLHNEVFGVFDSKAVEDSFPYAERYGWTNFRHKQPRTITEQDLRDYAEVNFQIVNGNIDATPIPFQAKTVNQTTGDIVMEGKSRASVLMGPKMFVPTISYEYPQTSTIQGANTGGWYINNDTERKRHNPDEIEDSADATSSYETVRYPTFVDRNKSKVHFVRQEDLDSMTIKEDLTT